MPSSASASAWAWRERASEVMERVRSSSGETRLKALREVKNQIIGNRTKKLQYMKLGAVPSIVSILCIEIENENEKENENENENENDEVLVQCAAAIGSFACGVDAGVKAVLEAGAFCQLLSLISHPSPKVADAAGRSLRIIYLSQLAPKYDFLQHNNIHFVVSLLNSQHQNVSAFGATIITHSCHTSMEQKALTDAGVLNKLIHLLQAQAQTQTQTQTHATLESLSTIIKDNPHVISKFVALTATPPPLTTLTHLTKDRSPRTRLLACICLIIIRNASPSYLQPLGIKTNLIFILLDLLDDPAPVPVADDAAFALSTLLAQNQDLHKFAFEANVLPKLCHHLHHASLHPKRYQGIFLALATLCDKLEYCRSTLLSLKVLNLITDALTHDSAEVRGAACICLKSVSRSVKNLSAGYFMNENIITPLVQLLSDTSTSVQVSALGAISNIVVDFTSHKSAFIQCGGLKQLVELSKSMDSTVRLNAVWALRNMVFLVDNRCKEGIFLELTPSTLVSLICDPRTSVQEQALAFVRNLVDGPVDSIDYVFAENGLLLQAIGRQLQNASKDEVLIQGMYVLCNVASGNESHKEAVIYHLIPQAENTSQSILVKFLQNSDSRLRTAAVWAVVNLTFPSSPGAFGRVVKLRNAGIVSQLRNLVNDPCLDVKLRVRTALGQFMTFGDSSV